MSLSASTHFVIDTQPVVYSQHSVLYMYNVFNNYCVLNRFVLFNSGNMVQFINVLAILFGCDVVPGIVHYMPSLRKYHITEATSDSEHTHV